MSLSSPELLRSVVSAGAVVATLVPASHYSGRESGEAGWFGERIMLPEHQG